MISSRFSSIFNVVYLRSSSISKQLYIIDFFNIRRNNFGSDTSKELEQNNCFIPKNNKNVQTDLLEM